MAKGEAKVPTFWLGVLKVIGGPLVKALAVAITSAWTKGGPIGAAFFGLAKLARHMASRCDELAQDKRTDGVTDGWARVAQQHLDEAAWAMKQAQASSEAGGASLEARIAAALEQLAARRGIDVKNLVGLFGSDKLVRTVTVHAPPGEMAPPAREDLPSPAAGSDVQ